MSSGSTAATSQQFLRQLAAAEQDGAGNNTARPIINTTLPETIPPASAAAGGAGGAALRSAASSHAPRSAKHSSRGEHQPAQASACAAIKAASPSHPLTQPVENNVMQVVAEKYALHAGRLDAPALGICCGAGDTAPFAPLFEGSFGLTEKEEEENGGIFAGHYPQPLLPLAKMAAKSITSPREQRSKNTSRVSSPVSSAKKKAHDDDGGHNEDEEVEADPMAFFRAHRLYFVDEEGSLPDLSRALSIIKEKYKNGSLSGSPTPPPAAGDTDSNTTPILSGPTSPTTATNGASVSVEALVRTCNTPEQAIKLVQLVSSTTMPPKDAGGGAGAAAFLGVDNGPRSGTPHVVKSRGPDPLPAPVCYTYIGPESVYGPYFEPLCWASCGQIVHGYRGGRGVGLEGMGESRKASSLPHRRLLAASAAAAAQTNAVTLSLPGDAASLHTNTSISALSSLAEACDVIRVATANMPLPLAHSQQHSNFGRGATMMKGGPTASPSSSSFSPQSLATINWAVAWRSLLLMESDSLRLAACRAVRLDAFANDFAAFVGPIAQSIVEQIHLPHTSPHRTHRPLAGFPNVYVVRGLIFFICSSPSRKALYGSAEAANKAAANEIRAQRVLRGSPHINHKVFGPLCCTVTALGHRVFVSAPMPIRSPRDIVYGFLPGSTDGVRGGAAGASVTPCDNQRALRKMHFTTTNFAVMNAYEISELFALNVHKVPIPHLPSASCPPPLAAPTSSETEPATSPNELRGLPPSGHAQITLPADSKLVYTLPDGATWLLDAARIAPSAACAYASSKLALKDDTTGKSLCRHASENIYNAHLSILFRPEFLRTYALGSTNADSALRCQPKSDQEHLSFMINALYTTNIPAATTELLGLEAKGQLRQEEITTILHNNGVNARYMGKIYSDVEHMGSRPADVRSGLRAKLALEMSARTFKAFLAHRLTQEPLFTQEQLLDRLGSEHTSAVHRLSSSNPAAEEESIVLDLVQRLLLCKENSRENFWEKEMRPLMERKFGVFVCPAVVAASAVEERDESPSDGANLKVYRALDVSGKRRVEKPKSSVRWIELPGGKSLVDEEATNEVHTLRTKAVLYPLLGPNALENSTLLARVEQLARFEIAPDHKGKRLICRFGFKVQPCTALTFSQPVAAMMRQGLAIPSLSNLSEVLAMEEDPVELRAAVESAARVETHMYHKIAESDARSVLPVVMLSKAIAHRGLTFPATLINKIQDVRKLVPTDLVNILTYIQMGELFMLCRRFDRAETAFSTGLMRIGQFVAHYGASSGSAPLATGGLLSATQPPPASDQAAKKAEPSGVEGSAQKPPTPSNKAAAPSSVSPSQPPLVGSISATQQQLQPICDFHPVGFLDVLVLVCRSMARLFLSSGKRPSSERARLVLDYYQYAVYIAEGTHHRLLPHLLFEIAAFRRHFATLQRDPATGGGLDDGEGTSHHELGGTVGSRATRRTNRTTGAGGSHRRGQQHASSASGAAAATAAERNRRATSMLSEDADGEGNDDADTFVKRPIDAIEQVILPRDLPIYNKYGGFPSAAMCDVTNAFEFVSQLSLFQGLGGGGLGGTVTISPPATALNNTVNQLMNSTVGFGSPSSILLGNTVSANGSPSLGPTLVVKDRGDAQSRERKVAAPLTTYNASLPAPQASPDPFTNAVTNIELSGALLVPRAVPQEVRPLLWRAYQLLVLQYDEGGDFAGSGGGGGQGASHGASRISMGPMRAARPAGNTVLGEALVEIGVLDRDANKIEGGVEDLAVVLGSLSRRALRAELRLVDVLFDASRTVCPYTNTETSDVAVLGRTERLMQAMLQRILASSSSSGQGITNTKNKNSADRFPFELYALVERYGRLVDAFSRLPTAKREDAARRYLVDVLPPAIGPAHPILSDIYETLRTHYMYLGEARDEAAARTNAIITAGDYALSWLECAVKIKGWEQRIAQRLRLFCEKIVKPLRSGGGGAHERAAAWRFFVQCGAILSDASAGSDGKDTLAHHPLGGGGAVTTVNLIEKDPKIKEAMEAMEGAFKVQHRVVVESEKKAMLQRRITEYAKEMQLAVRRVKQHKNRMDHYCEIQLKTIETVGAAITALMSDVTDDDILMRAEAALEYRDEVLRVENQRLQRRNLFPNENEEECDAEAGEENAIDTNTNGMGLGPNDDAVGDRNVSASSKSTQRPTARAYVSPYACLSPPDEISVLANVQHSSSASRILDAGAQRSQQPHLEQHRRPSVAGGQGDTQRGPSRSMHLTGNGAKDQPPPPSSPGGFLPRLQLGSDSINQQVGRLLNKANQSMVARNHNPIRNL